MTDQSSDEDGDLKLRISSSQSMGDSQSEHDEVESDDDLSERDTGTESDDGNDKVGSSEQHSSSEWIEFNKKVVSMRPLFKSSKVQFIHKASRIIKALRTKKGNQEQVEKNNKKADRLVQEIAYINRLKRDVIAKFALLHSSEEVTKIIKSADSTMEYRIKAKVASMPKISKAAEEYHAKNPDWRDSLFKLMQLAGKNMKKKRRKMRGKSNKGSKINEENRQNATKQQSKKFQAHDGDDFDSERFGVSNFPEPPPGLEDSMGSNESCDEENLRDGKGSEEDDDDDEEQKFQESYDESDSEGVGLILRPSKSKPERALEENLKNKRQREVRSNLEESASNKIQPAKQKLVSVQEGSSKVNYKKKKDGNNEKGNTNKNALGKGVKSKRSHSSDSDEKDNIESESKLKSNVDPFFMTSDNKEYKTLWKVEPADSFKNKKPNEPEFMFKNARPFKDVVNGKSKKGPPPAKVPRHDRKAKNAAGGKAQQSEVSFENLHPSWQAKKKMSGVAFQGKKVVFDDD